jgi:hypothetical protein
MAAAGGSREERWSVTPDLGKLIECIPYVRQDQVAYIQ